MDHSAYRHRRSAASIRGVDSQGKPAANADVQVKLTNHEFLFAHPSVGAVTGWDFTDGAWLRAPSGLIWVDNSPKPAYFELQKMIHEEWSTDVTVHTDANGMASLEGYRGQYTVSCGSQSGTFTLTDGMKDIVEVSLR